MSKILVLQGIPASGKTTYSREFLKEHDDYVRVNRDDIRRMLGKYWMPSRETLVTEIEHNIVKSALYSGYNVIIDDSNLNSRTIDLWKIVASAHKAEIEFKKLEVSLEEALKRDKEREHPVGEEVIKTFYNKYENV